jgi:hypothetical protein
MMAYHNQIAEQGVANLTAGGLTVSISLMRFSGEVGISMG